MTAPATHPDPLRRAFAMILAWPCPVCGRPFPCPCDKLPADDTAEADTKPAAGTDPQRSEGGPQ